MKQTRGSKGGAFCINGDAQKPIVWYFSTGINWTWWDLLTDFEGNIKENNQTRRGGQEVNLTSLGSPWMDFSI